YCWAGNAYFAELYGVTKTSISNWISSLQKNGYIEVRFIYKENSKEIQSRHISIANNIPIQNNLNTYTKNIVGGIQNNFTDNNKIINNKIISKDIITQKQKPLIPKETKKAKKTKDIVTMRNMINAFTENESIREKLLEYFNIRVKKGLQPNQWKIILDDLRDYAGESAKIAIDKINGSIAGGYMQIIAPWEKDRKNNFNKPKFDNTAGREVKAVVNMTEDEKKEFEDNLATDEDGNLLKF
ncbi:MAG: helix-turn-helix domain-containing protein, partial [Clostridiales bacterium]|nr:helix-turn-helix domain-containing protein [Clostridiales bacterium]